MRWGLTVVQRLLPQGVVMVAVGLAVQGAAGEAFASSLASHRAIYDLQLADPERTSGFQDATGRIVVEWQDVCSGYTFNSRSVTEFIAFTGEVHLSDRRYSSWEASDGKTFRFSVENFLNDEHADGASGIADRAKAAVSYETPAENKVELPDDVIFPTELSVEIIEAAKDGKKIVKKALFEGTEDGSVFNSVAFIGRRHKPGGEKVTKGIKGAEPLGKMAYWPVTLSYFELDKGADLPVYEVSYYLYSNGISDRLKLNFGDFQLEAKLAEIEFLGTPDCS